MAKFIVRRFFYLLLTLIVVSLVVFVVSELAPGNIAHNVLGAYTTPAQEASFLRQLGLDRSLPARYVAWLVGSDWQAARLIGLPVQRIRSQMGYYEWWAVAEDGTLTQWDLKGADLIATHRKPDGTTEKVVDNARWKIDEKGNREFWGMDHGNRAVKWTTGAATTPTGGVDLVLDGGRLSDTDLKDSDGRSLRPNAGALQPGSLPTDTWLTRDVDLASLAGQVIKGVQLGVDYRDTDVKAPAAFLLYVRSVDIVQGDDLENPVAHWDFKNPGSNFSGEFASSGSGKEGEADSASIVGAEDVGLGTSSERVYRLSGAVTPDSAHLTYDLFTDLEIRVVPGMHLRYSIFYPSLAGGEETWILTGSWVRQQGGPSKYIPLSRGIVRGDPGVSIKTGRPVEESLARRLRNSVMLTALALAFVVPLALFLGMIAGLNEGKFIDRFLSIFGLVTTSTPEFALGIFLVVVFATWLKILPGATVFPSDDAAFKNPQMLVLPVLTLALMELGYLLRMTRASLLDVLRQPYIRTAELKGLPLRRILFKHALRNALIAPITVIMLHVNWMIGGIVVVESIFGFPGLGKFLYDAALFKDVFAIEAGAMVMVLLAVGSQLVADIAYTLLNPRIRHQ